MIKRDSLFLFIMSFAVIFIGACLLIALIWSLYASAFISPWFIFLTVFIISIFGAIYGVMEYGDI